MKGRYVLGMILAFLLLMCFLGYNSELHPVSQPAPPVQQNSSSEPVTNITEPGEPPYDYSAWLNEGPPGEFDTSIMFWHIANMPYVYADKRKDVYTFWRLGYGDCDDKAYAFAHYLYFGIHATEKIYIVHCKATGEEIGHAYVVCGEQYFDLSEKKIGDDAKAYKTEMRREGWDTFSYELYTGQVK